MAHWLRVSAVSESLGAAVAGGPPWGRLEEILSAVAADRPDFICFPEICTCSLPLAQGVREQAVELPGPFTKTLGRLAQQVGANLMVPTLERDRDRVYNAVPLVTSAGDFVGVYRKNYPTVGEMEAGITPGTQVPVFECQGTRVGMAVCFDLNFSSVAAELERQQARLVFWPSMYWGGQFLGHWAMRYGFYMVAAYGAESAVVDMSGRFLARQGNETHQVRGRRLPPWVTVAINTDRELFHLDFNQDKFPAIRREYGPDVAIEVHQPEAVFTLASLSDHFTVADLCREFQLEPLRDYLARSQTLRATKSRNSS